ncbi:tripartite tricarboxylate transporter substrate binding protein [Pigmentiphaga sp. H8]|uniref:Bug family tripartite tricarboxylate transporter substrate binding protein n=1 Tax=Pigmentiphaga sp. H8 TaxID=2488560 RepID=UPI0013756F52|nr:tripartite tricarboxylate transporter substrate binding protein [Pigmentiphaga sp. H8]
MSKPPIARMLAAAALAAASSAAVAAAPAYPARPLKIVTPFAVGQGPDVLLRIVAEKLTATLGQQVIVENRPGASGFLAFEAGRRAAPDGYTLVHMDSYHVGTQPYLFARLPYDVRKDFDPVTPLVRNYFFVVVPAASPWRTMGDLIASAKARPGGVSYGSWGVASPAHLGGLLLEAATGTSMMHVPYKESAQLFQSVAVGDVNWTLGSPVSAGPVYQSGKVRFLAVAAPQRLPGYAEVPTVAQAGGPANFEVGGWNGLFAPKGTPAGIVQRLNEGIAAALKAPDVQEKLATFTYEAYAMPPRDMARLVDEEIAKWGPIIKGAGIHLD